jgi:tetratricopeptide (TPR) repeat protein
VLAVLAALAVRWIARAARARDTRRLLGALVLIAASAGASAFATRTFGIRADAVSGFTNLAWLHQQRGELAEAEALLLEGLARTPPADRAGLLCALGDVREAAHDVTTALGLFRQCAARNPGFPDVWFRIGRASEKAGLARDAVDAYRTQLRVLPGHEQALQALSRLGATR